VHYHIDRKQLRSTFLISSISVLKTFQVYVGWFGALFFSFCATRFHELRKPQQPRIASTFAAEKAVPQDPDESMVKTVFWVGKLATEFSFSSSPFFGWSKTHTLADY
jgi:hypothetical protein